MSAPSPMRRTAIFMLALAVGLPAFAFGQTSDAPVRPASRHKAVETRVLRSSSRARSSTRARRSSRLGHRASARHSARPAARRASARQSYASGRSGFAAHRVSALGGLRGREAARSAPLSEREKLAREAAARQVEKTLRAAGGVETAGMDSLPGAQTDTRSVATPHVSGVSMQAMARPVPAVDSTGADQASAPDPAEASEVERYDDPPLAEPASLDIRGGMPPPLRGSLALLERQDQRLEADGLQRIENESDLSVRIAHHLLVPVPVSDALAVSAQLPLHHRFCRPWTALFLADLARAHAAEFHRPLEVSSAVRTVAYQEHLERINGNAAPAYGQVFSPHLMGATVDIAKKQMSLAEIAWMRRRLLALELAGKIDVEEEFEQACFHITVYRSYEPARLAHPPSQAGASQKTAAPAISDDSAQPDGQ